MKEVMKYTQDWWAPNYPGDRVKLMFLKLLRGWRVAVWGADDLGMEFDTNNKLEAIYMFHLLSSRPVINVKDLEELNFEYA